MNGGSNMFMALFVAGGMLIVILLGMTLYAMRYKRVAPNQAMVISGRRRVVRDSETGEQKVVGYRIITSGGTFVAPIVERVDVLSLEAIPVEFEVKGQWRDGTDANIQGEAQVAVGQNETDIHEAATRLLNKGPEEIADLARQFLAREMRIYTLQTTAAEMRTSLALATEEVAHAWQLALADIGLRCLALDIIRIG
jgi:flotillin